MDSGVFYFPGIGAGRLQELRGLLDAGTEHAFYDWPEWRALRREVRRMDSYECQLCKARGRYAKGVLVHHVQHLRDRPDLALSIWDPDTGARQLVTVCKQCHEDLHPEALRTAAAKPPITTERWD